MDFTTVARGYSEAARRGVLDSTVGRGSFVRSRTRTGSKASLRTAPVDLTMNLPPDPDDPALIERMQAGLDEVARDLVPLLHYQGFGGSPQAKDAASSWLGRRGLVPSQERLFITPGAHPALSAIFSLLVQPGDTVLCESITYPGYGPSPRSIRRSFTAWRWMSTASCPRRWRIFARGPGQRRCI
ncbi:aminotransferase class I/II-fold pyridoxal phosphate-dependent enzyme [Acidocella sp. MX-AZ03]|uniref:aminotransferase class I/II-fold pyridoxal phosphate-dependent enzyme n=1 Tax=Acidocella sp. MX-AZ03 TaxID=2697363 RepID=UPI0022DDB6A9|nr:aminotransferase class I/II-fold pyridoxal phosphate-dependent enzyme [Acidocella sp. MX-AZ03]WBO59080.1 aminotransferase class I/II-fold pyridoxal phosphate-dependent enzyme [Acidocella sp. MX-AZ03]